MGKDLKVSVVIPAHNEEAVIEGAVQAAKRQDFYSDFEILVIDNASTDNTAAVARQCGAEVILEEKKGVQFARERGRMEAKGEILAYLDADCIAPPDWLRKALPYFADPRVVGLSGPYDYFDAGPFFRSLSYGFQLVCFRMIHLLIHDLLHAGAVMIGGNAIMRADAMETIGGFDTAIVFYGDDTDTARRLSRIGKIRFKREMTIRSYVRRFDRMNPLKVALIYMSNFFWVIMFKRPAP